MKIEVVIVTHGKLGRALLDTASEIAGRSDGIKAKEIKRDMGLEKIKREINRLKAGRKPGVGLLILTDMLGGTPSNVCLPLTGDNDVEVVTGVNLPMVVTAILKKNIIKDLKKLSEIIASAGRDSIVKCSRIDG